MDFRRLDRFLQRHRRDDRGDAFREHRLARAGRADHQHVVPASDRDLHRALDVSLAFDVGEIDVVVLVGREKLGQIAAHRLATASLP